MTDDNETPSNPTPSPRAALRKITFIFGALFVVWAVMGQIVPRLFFHRGGLPLSEEIRPVPPPAPTDIPRQRDEQIAELQNHISQMESRLQAFDAWQQHPPAAIDNNRITHLEEMVDKQEATINSMQSQLGYAQARAAFAALKDAVEHSEPFAPQLQQLAQLSANRNDIQELLAQLKPYEADGVPTLSVLQSQFETLIPKALAADEDSSSLAHNLQSLIRIRKVGDQPGGDDEAILARAESALNRGDVAASLKETAALSPAAIQSIAAWNTKVQAFIVTHETLSALQLILITP